MKYCKYTFIRTALSHSLTTVRKLYLSPTRWNDNSDKTKKKQITVTNDFTDLRDRSKESYLDVIRIFVNRDVHRRGHVEFIYSALKHMEAYNVHKDVDVYKALIDVLPKGKFISQNIIQSEFMHYPKQQQCIIDVLEQMEDNGVMPDSEIELMILNTFGKRGHPLRKYRRMMYWMPKFRNLSPWPIPNPPPCDIFELAQIAIARICSVDPQSKVTVYHTSDISDIIEDTWIVSGQSPVQQNLLRIHKQDEPIYVDGPFRVWLRDKLVNYFVLRANPNPLLNETTDHDDVSRIQIPIFDYFPPKAISSVKSISVYEQEDGVILAVCATGSSSKNSLLSWIKHLEYDGNHVLANIPIVFTLKTAGKEISVKEYIDDKTEIE